MKDLNSIVTRISDTNISELVNGDASAIEIFLKLVSDYNTIVTNAKRA